NNQSFDLADVEFLSVRYIQVEYHSGEDIRLDAILAINYNKPERDTEIPLITGLDDYWYWENQIEITLTWDVFDATPWNYSILINGQYIEVGHWNGSDITFTIIGAVKGKIEITLILYDVFGNRNEDLVIIEIRALESKGNTPTSNIKEEFIYLIVILFSGVGSLVFFKWKFTTK
ncbi:MAG: hypothetical protein ACFFCQ_12315, partial [Promethearchaeota archaeon]